MTGSVREGPSSSLPTPVDGASWARLAPGMLLVEPIRELLRFIPLLLVLVFAGRAGDSGPPWGLIGAAAVIALGVTRWLTTRYRIGPALVEVRTGLLQRRHLTVPRDRVRTVEVSAHPLQRVLGLVKLTIGTASSHHGAHHLELDGVRANTVDAMRVELLRRASPTMQEQVGQPDEPAAQTVVELDRRWIWYAPATLSGVVTGAFLIGLGWRLANEANVDPGRISLIPRVLRSVRENPWWIDVLIGVAGLAVAVSVLSLAGYLISFWGYRVTRQPGGTLQISRGLLTTRTTAVEGRRLQGVDRAEPLLLRWVGGARSQIIATGVRHREQDRGGSLLVPPAPLRTVMAVEDAVAGPAAGSVTVVGHGPAARRRRYARALGAALLLLAAVAGLGWRAGWPGWPGVALPAAVPVLLAACLLARDRARNLGHRLSDGQLITTQGSLVRHRRVLAVRGVIGLTVRQSVFQRRAGLVTVIATTAAGAQRYAVHDVPTDVAGDLMVGLLPATAQLLDQLSPAG